jgi:hypothetical protein
MVRVLAPNCTTRFAFELLALMEATSNVGCAANRVAANRNAIVFIELRSSLDADVQTSQSPEPDGSIVLRAVSVIKSLFRGFGPSPDCRDEFLD